MRAVFEGRPSSTIAILAAIHSRDDFRMITISPAIFCDGANLHTLIAAYRTRLNRAPRVYFKYSFPHSAILWCRRTLSMIETPSRAFGYLQSPRRVYSAAIRCAFEFTNGGAARAARS